MKRVVDILTDAGVTQSATTSNPCNSQKNSSVGLPGIEKTDIHLHLHRTASTRNSGQAKASEPSPLRQGFLSVPSHTRRRSPALENLKVVKIYDHTYCPGGDLDNRPSTAPITSRGVYSSQKAKQSEKGKDTQKESGKRVRRLESSKLLLGMTMEVDETPSSSMRSTAGDERHARQDAREHGFEPNTASRAGSPPRETRSSRIPSPSSDSWTTIRRTSEGGVLGKRSASAMEEPGSLYDSSTTASSGQTTSTPQTATPTQQAVDQVLITALRRESMISPMDPVSDAPASSSGLRMESPSALPMPPYKRRPTQTSPSARSPGLKDPLKTIMNLSLDANPTIYGDEHRPSLPGFKSLFGLSETEERPSISRNSSSGSSGFPDLQTLKGPLTIASIPYSRSRGSRDSAATSATTWSSRSSVGTRDSVSTTITVPPSAALTAPSTLFSGGDDGSKPYSPLSSDPPKQRLYRKGSSNGLPLAESSTTVRNGKLVGPLVPPSSFDLSKRPSYANFGAELELRRVAERAAADAQEDWRRQSDNATLLSAERLRLLGRSPKSVSQLELRQPSLAGIDVTRREYRVPANDSTGKTAADEALLAARARLLRYQSYPFGSKEAQLESQPVELKATDGQRRLSQVPRPTDNAWESTNVVNLTNSPDFAAGTSSTFPHSPEWLESVQPRLHGFIDSQRDMQFEEIVRKASVDLAKRSANSSLTGTPVGTARPLPLLHGTPDPASISAVPATRIVSEAELANAREREQRQQVVNQAANVVTSDISRLDRASAVRTAPPPARPPPYNAAVSHQQHDQNASHLQLMDFDHDSRGLTSCPSDVPELGRTGQESLYWNSRTVVIPQRSTESRRGSPRNAPSRPGGSPFLAPSTHAKPSDAAQAKQHHQSRSIAQTPGHPSLAQPRRKSLVQHSVSSEPVVPYYDNPEPPSAVGSNSSADYPSVLRKEYNGTPPGGPAHHHMTIASGHAPPVYPGQHHPNLVAPTQYGVLPPQQQFFGSWNSDDRPGPYTTMPPVANRTLSTPSMLSLGTTTLPGPRYTCEHCGKSFSRPSSLKIHIYSHTGEKPYKCTWPNCTRSFSVQSNLKRHAKVHLENNGQPAPSTGNSIMNVDIGSTGHGNSAHSPLRGSEAASNPASSCSSYPGGFLTPQTTQPLPSGSTPDGYFDARMHARQPPPHSPAAAGVFKQNFGATHSSGADKPGYSTPPAVSQLASNSSGLGSRLLSQLQYTTQGSQSRRVSGSSAYEDPEEAEEDELDE